jgi:hypothetical protein
MTQCDGALAFAAAGTPLNAAPTERPIRPSTGQLKLAAGNAQASAQQAPQSPPGTTWQQCLTPSFFFDGTGNNLDSGVGTIQHSDVMRPTRSQKEIVRCAGSSTTGILAVAFVEAA